MKAAVFLDRDGTIIEDTHYLRDPEKVKLIPNAIAGLREMRRKGYLLYVISNQSGVARGLISQADLASVDLRFRQLCQAEGVTFENVLYCVHQPSDDCQCRKPRAGNVPREFRGEEIDFALSYTVGDKVCDVQLGETLGTKRYLVMTGKGPDNEAELINLGVKFQRRDDLLEMSRDLPLLQGSARDASAICLEIVREG